MRRVAAFVEGDQRVADVGARAVRERLRVAGQEPRERMSGIEGLPPRGQAAEPVVAAARDELGVHHLALALDVLAVEARGDEELGEPVERAFEVRGVDVEEKVRVSKRRGGVAGAAVLGEKAVMFAGVRILPGAEKQHVFEKVREARAIVRVVAAAHVDVDCRRRLVGVRIGDHQRLQSVVQHDGPVVPGIGGAAFDLDVPMLDGRPLGTGRRRFEWGESIRGAERHPHRTTSVYPVTSETRSQERATHASPLPPVISPAFGDIPVFGDS